MSAQAVKRTIAIALLLTSTLAYAATATAAADGADGTDRIITRIALGSCAKQYLPQPIWQQIVAYDPQLFVFLGDNVYADTSTAEGFAGAYRGLEAQEGYRKLRELVPVYATWDDHDYGGDDLGADFPAKEISRRAFFEFFGVPPDSPRRRHGGVYDEVELGPPGQRIQILLLDTRWFRSPWTRDPTPFGKNYIADDNPALTILGEEQWRWLDRQLVRPARLRILVSSIQVVDDEHPFETWGKFPRERRRLVESIRRTGASGLIIVSGDRHFGEISRLDGDVPYPLYDFTTSGLTHSAPPAAGSPNTRRVRAAYGGLNFGTIEIDWNQPDPEIRMQLRDLSGKVRLEVALHLSELGSEPAGDAR